MTALSPQLPNEAHIIVDTKPALNFEGQEDGNERVPSLAKQKLNRPKVDHEAIPDHSLPLGPAEMPAMPTSSFCL